MNEQFDRDYLTGIYNRKGLFQLFEQLSSDLIIGLMFFDIDNFKTVNDMYGHKKGDETLIRFAQLLMEVLPEESQVARLGGDEFVAIIPDASSKNACSEMAACILNRVKQLRQQDHAFEIISTSVGIVYQYKVSDGLETALNHADKAMYFAKEQGKNTYVFYEDYESSINYESQIEMDFPHAMAEGRIFVKYHPVHQLQSSRLICTEACCLWKTQQGELLGRNDFREILSKNDLINEMDLHVFELVCRDYASLRGLLKNHHRMGVQFSHLFLLDESRIRQMDQIMARYGVEPSDFEINLDENMFSTRVMPGKLIECMRGLVDKGFSIALSHFGADFSSVRYLKDLPISKLVLDGSFIRENMESEEGRLILKNIIKLGRGFHFTVVGCGADNDKALLALSECGCDASTGEFFCKKLSAADYVNYIKKNLEEDNDTITYDFCKDLSANKRFAAAVVVGDEVKLGEGISPKWGAVSFPGGPSQTNYLKFPAELFENKSFTFSMWIKPQELQNWVSALYVRFQGGFLSFMPNIPGGRCMLRIIDDGDMEHWNDSMTGALTVGKWTFVACSFDSISSIARIYINGQLEAELTGVPSLDNPKEVWLGSDVFQMSYCGRISAFQINVGALENEEIFERYREFCSEEGFAGNEAAGEVTLSKIEVHDPAIFEDESSKRFYIYGTGGVAFSSNDLLHWSSIGRVVEGMLPAAQEWTGGKDIWAPDIVKVGEEYRLYCSNSRWGVRQSCIFLAVSDRPEGPFIPRDIVVKTRQQGNVNAIDANIIEDAESGRQYMVYGSFWGGIHMVELDKETGLPKEGEGLGKQIAVRPQWNDCAIEGPYIIYHPDTKYYYLFVSYGSLTCDYNIRVARSKCITGPYLDFHGKDMVDPEDDSCSTGLMISCGYKYLTGHAQMGPGHNSVLLRKNGEMYLVNHIRRMAFNADPGPAFLEIRKMIMTPDGWPIALGQPYNSETLLEVRAEQIPGKYERIELRPSIPQGIQHAHPMKLLEGGRLEIASVVGTWRQVDAFSLQLSYGPITEYVYFEKGLDKEKNKSSVIMCGLTSRGICTWAKKEELSQ